MYDVMLAAGVVLGSAAVSVAVYGVSLSVCRRLGWIGPTDDQKNAVGALVIWCNRSGVIAGWTSGFVGEDGVWVEFTPKPRTADVMNPLAGTLKEYWLNVAAVTTQPAKGPLVWDEKLLPALTVAIGTPNENQLFGLPRFRLTFRSAEAACRFVAHTDPL